MQGCDQRSSVLFDEMEAPVLNISNGTAYKSLIVDTIKKNDTYILLIESQIQEYEFNFLNAEIDHDSVNNVLIINPTLDYVGDVIGQITITDFLENKVTAELDLTVIDNWLPVVVVDVENIADVSPYEIEVDLSESYDQDKRFGGEVVNYHYRIIGQTTYNLTTDLSSIRYIFQTGGQKSIRVRVQDNDGAWSEEVIEYINL